MLIRNSKSIILFVLISLNLPLIAQQDSILPHDTFIIESKLLNEKRVINVWTPPRYERYDFSLPVIYMADGGITEDFPHVALTFSELIATHKIPPCILVGIENTQRRRDLTGPTEVKKDKKIAPLVGGSENFRAFINDELFPEIEKRYRVTDKRGILGESLAGLFVMETLFLKPEMFDYYIAFDPSLWWNNHYLVEHANVFLNELPMANKLLWFAGSNAKDISKYTQSLASVLLRFNSPTLKFCYSDEPNEHHNTIFRATKEKAILWTLVK